MQTRVRRWIHRKKNSKQSWRIKPTWDFQSVDKTTSRTTSWTCGHKGNEIEISSLSSSSRVRKFETRRGQTRFQQRLFGCRNQSLWLRAVISGSIQKWWQLIWLIFMHRRHSGPFPAVLRFHINRESDFDGKLNGRAFSRLMKSRFVLNYLLGR